MRLFSKFVLGGLVAGAALIGSIAANASLIPTLTGTANNGWFFYDIDLSKSLTTNDTKSYLTLYDIPGYIAGSATVLTGNFTEVDELTSPMAFGQIKVDDPTMLNARFIYNGTGQTGPGLVATVKIQSIYHTVRPDALRYDGQDRKIGGKHTLEGNTGTVDGPAVPEMSMLPVFGTLFGLGGLALRRRMRG